MKIAITSTDGVKVNQHFGKATCFHIYANDRGLLRLLEKRGCPAYSDNNPDHQFHPERFESTFKAIADCDVLVTAKIGAVPADELMERGLSVIVTDDKIKAIVFDKTT